MSRRWLAHVALALGVPLLGGCCCGARQNGGLMGRFRGQSPATLASFPSDPCCGAYPGTVPGGIVPGGIVTGPVTVGPVTGPYPVSPPTNGMGAAPFAPGDMGPPANGDATPPTMPPAPPDLARPLPATPSSKSRLPVKP